MALSTELSKGRHDVPAYAEYLGKVHFAPLPPPGFRFAEARPDQYNPGVALPLDGSHPPTEYNMHIDDNLYAATGVEPMQWAMQCSIAGLQMLLGENAPELRSCQPDMEKFLQYPVSHPRHQLGYIIDTQTMTVTIPDDKCKELLDTLKKKWGSSSRHYSFPLSAAAEVLGLFMYLC